MLRGRVEHYLLPAAEVLGNGVLAEGVYEHVRAAFSDGEGRG